MKYRLMEYLACPQCRSSKLSVEEKQVLEVPICTSHFPDNQRDGVQLATRVEVEIQEGTIHCGECGKGFPIENGIPNFLLKEEGRSTQHQHTIFDQNQPYHLREVF